MRDLELQWGKGPREIALRQIGINLPSNAHPAARFGQRFGWLDLCFFFLLPSPGSPLELIR